MENSSFIYKNISLLITQPTSALLISYLHCSAKLHSGELAGLFYMAFYPGSEKPAYGLISLCCLGWKVGKWVQKVGKMGWREEDAPMHPGQVGSQWPFLVTGSGLSSPPGLVPLSSLLSPVASLNTSDIALPRCWDGPFLHLITLVFKTVFLHVLPEIFPFVAPGRSAPCFTISRSFK